MKEDITKVAETRKDMRYLVKVYVCTNFPDDNFGTNILFKVTADSREQACERVFSLLPQSFEADVYEIWEPGEWTLKQL